MFNESINYIRRENFYYPKQSFEIGWLISDIPIMKKIQKNLAPYL